MRIAAWILTAAATLACLWFVAVAVMLIRPGFPVVTFFEDSHFAAVQARAAFPMAGLALLNGIGALLLSRKRRHGALWIVIGAGVVALACALWHYVAIHLLVADYPDGIGNLVTAAERIAWLLAWAALAFSVTGWAAWLVNRRITIGQGRD